MRKDRSRNSWIIAECFTSIVLFGLCAGLCAAPALSQARPTEPARRDAPAMPRNGNSPVVTLRPGVTILESAGEPLPIRKAAEDLANDVAKVLGSRPRIVTRPQDASPVTIMIGETSELPPSLRPPGLTAPESFSISVRTANWGANRQAKAVVLAGPDVRGTIYAIYQFSQDYLGVDPMYYWTDKPPRRRAAAPPLRCLLHCRKISTRPSSSTAASSSMMRISSPDGLPARRPIRPASRSRCGTKSTKPSSGSKGIWSCPEPGSFPLIRRSSWPASGD